MATPIDGAKSHDTDKESFENYPKEIAGSLKAFKTSLQDVENILEPLVNSSLPDIHSQLSPLDRAKLDLVSAYAINSMFWVYLGTQGINPREHPIRHELGRIQKYMKRAQEISDKEKAAKLDKGAAKRFVRNALWEPKNKEQDSSRKRKANGQEQGGSKRR